MAKETKTERTKEVKKEFSRRAFASVFGGFSFLIMVLTGLALFSAPSCRVARETGWASWGYSKEELQALHVWFAVIFAAVAIYHIYLNWGPLKRYFEGKTSHGIGLRTEWVVALLLCLVIYGGTVRGAWPFASLIEWKESYKHGVSGQVDQGQGWRGGRGGAALKGGCGESGCSESGGLAGQGRRGGRGSAAIKGGSGCGESGSCESQGQFEQGRRGGRGGAKGGSGCSESGSCESQAQVQQGRRGGRALTTGGGGCSESGGCESQSQVEPRRGAGAGQTSGQRGRGGQFQGQGRGMGQMTLSEFCNSEGIELRRAIAQFRSKGLAVQSNMTMREIADAAGIHPRELRNILGTE